MSRKFLFGSLFLLVFVSSSCYKPAKLTPDPPSQSTIYAELRQTLTPQPEENGAYSILETPSSSPEQPNPRLPNQNDVDLPTVFIHPGLSEQFTEALNLENFQITADETTAVLQIQIYSENTTPPETGDVLWVYVLVAPFYTIEDKVSMNNLRALWSGERVSDFNFNHIYVTERAKSALEILLGESDQNNVTVVTDQDLAGLAIGDDPVLALLPFEELNAHWKVLRVEGQSPIDTHFDPQTYPLSLQIGMEGELSKADIALPSGNFDPNQRTNLVMTGVTALTRATAYQMALHGNQFPGQDIQEILSTADLAHISNEVPFAENCPDPDPVQPDLIFCSAPERFELLEFVGTDIVELSGNHMLDYGVEAMNLTLEMYQEREWLTYAGGWDLESARSPALVTHNSNNLAFLGCNPAGPPNAWATDSRPGSAPCGDYTWLLAEISRLQEQDYLPIVTLQYAEDYTAYPSPKMESDFQRLADAGAVVVNGSQAHTPKMMVFYNDSFLHYGLGNLFFDQMDVYYNDVQMSGTRDEFIDRLTFYNGELISIELLTAKLEDYARPRLTTGAERDALLERIFSIAIDSLEER